MEGGSGGLFTLHDINGDGVPELIIWAPSQGGYFSAYAAYTFIDGDVASLEIVEGFGGRGSSLFSRPDGREGLIVTSGGSGYSAYTLIMMERHSVAAQVDIFENWSPRQSQFDFSFYYVRGVDVTPMQFPDGAEYEWWYVNHLEWLSFGFILVDEKEYSRVLGEVFGGIYARYAESPREISEGNIQNIVFGWRY